MRRLTHPSLGSDLRGAAMLHLYMTRQNWLIVLCREISGAQAGMSVEVNEGVSCFRLTEQQIREKGSSPHRLEIVFPDDHGMTLRPRARMHQITRVMGRISRIEPPKSILGSSRVGPFGPEWDKVTAYRYRRTLRL